MYRDHAAQRILSAVFVGIACLILVPSLKAAGPDPVEVSRLLSRASLEAIHLREDTNQMRNFVVNDVTWETHGVYADLVLGDIRAMLEKVELLDSCKSSGMEWQKSVIDQLDPLMNELTSTIKEVYEAIDERPFDRTSYNGYLEANYEHAERLAALLSDSVQYGKVKIRFQENRKLMQD